MNIFSSLLFVFIFMKTEAGSYENVSLLNHNLLENYDKYVRPELDQSLTTKIYIGFHLITLVKLDEVNGRLSIVGYLNLKWTNYKLNWKPEEYGNTSNTYLPASEIWKPLIVAANTVDRPQFVNNEDSLINVNSNGSCYWQPGDLWNINCGIDTTKFPFDIQKCNLILLAWPATVVYTEFISMYKTISKDLFLDDVTWELIRTEANVDTGVLIPKISFGMEFKRRFDYFLVTLLCPIYLIGILNIFVFKIPAASGERIGYAITVLLSVSVFMTIASDILPPSSIPHLSYISILLLENLILSCFIMLCTIVGLRFYHTPSEQPVPLIYHKMARCRCLHNNIVRNDDQDGIQLTKPGDKSENLTWTDVGEILDKIFFHLFMTALAIIHAVYIIQVIS